MVGASAGYRTEGVPDLEKLPKPLTEGGEGQFVCALAWLVLAVLCLNQVGKRKDVQYRRTSSVFEE